MITCPCIPFITIVCAMAYFLVVRNNQSPRMGSRRREKSITHPRNHDALYSIGRCCSCIGGKGLPSHAFRSSTTILHPTSTLTKYLRIYGAEATATAVQIWSTTTASIRPRSSLPSLPSPYHG